MLAESHRDRVEVILLSPRNPLNIGAAARAMANFGFWHLTVVAPFAPNWLEAKSAIGALELLREARSAARLAEAVARCTLVIGTGTLAHRKPEQPVVSLPDLLPIVQSELARAGRVALVFGGEKHGLTREDLAYCHLLVEIPTHPDQPSMNLGQAVAVCLYELATRAFAEDATEKPASGSVRTAASGRLELLAGLVERTMASVDYSPPPMRATNRRDLRLLLRRLAPAEKDVRRMLGLFRRILWRIEH